MIPFPYLRYTLMGFLDRMPRASKFSGSYKDRRFAIAALRKRLIAVFPKTRSRGADPTEMRLYLWIDIVPLVLFRVREVCIRGDALVTTLIRSQLKI